MSTLSEEGTVLSSGLIEIETRIGIGRSATAIPFVTGINNKNAFPETSRKAF